MFSDAADAAVGDVGAADASATARAVVDDDDDVVDDDDDDVVDDDDDDDDDVVDNDEEEEDEEDGLFLSQSTEIRPICLAGWDPSISLPLSVSFYLYGGFRSHGG